MFNMNKLPQSKDENRDDYKFPFGSVFGYTPYYINEDPLKTVYYIHNFELDRMLFGDGLPTGEEEAKVYCRIASRAWNCAKQHDLINFKKSLEKVTEDLKETIKIY